MKKIEVRKSIHIEYKSVLAGILSAAMFTVAAFGGDTVFNSDGSITRGGKSVSLDYQGRLLIGIDSMRMDFWHCYFRIDPQTKARKYFDTRNLEKKSLFVDPEKKTTIFKGEHALNGTGQVLKVSASISVNDDGRIRYAFTIDNAELFDKSVFNRGWLYTKMPFTALAGTTVKLDDKPVTIEKGRGRIDERVSPERVVLFSGSAGNMQVAFLPQGGSAHVSADPDNNKDFCLSLPDTFLIDLGAVTEPSSEDPQKLSYYYPSDDLYGPRYDLCRNLVQNPSFEAGFRYWQAFARNYPNPELYIIDTNVAFRGKKSLRLYGRKGQRIGMGLPATFAIPAEIDQDYTVSFYAKATSPQKLDVSTYGGRISLARNTWQFFREKAALNTEWRRYSFTFKAQDNIFCLFFNIEYPTEDVTAWIDCVQLEKGKLTDYTEKPICADLVTERFDNLFQPGEAMNARLEIHANPCEDGWVMISIEDFFGREVYRDEFGYAAGQNGLAVCRLPLESLGLTSGIYSVRADFDSDSGYSDTDFFRFGVMQFLDGKFKHKRMFATVIHDAPGANLVHAERLRNTGIGAVQIAAFSVPSPRLLAVLHKNGIIAISSIFRYGAYAGESPGKEALDQDNRKGPNEWQVSHEQKPRPGEKGYDPDHIPLDFIKTCARKKAAESPDLTYWKLANEPMHDLRDNVEALGKFARIMKAAYDGIKEANPNSVVLSPDPANMTTDGGIQWIDTYLKAGGRNSFDAVAIHPYRKCPENPDLDSDIAEFISMLKKHGYTGDIYFNEGMGPQVHIIPAYNLDPEDFNSAYDYRAGSISYDIGYGEKLSSAYMARSFSACFKYAAQVKLFMPWPSLLDLDLNMTPRVDNWIVNVLGHLLGNADYRQDIVVNDDVRCYLFEDDEHRPIAVFWNTSAAVNRRMAPAPVLTFPFAEGEIDVINLMGSLRPGRGREALPITPFPLFLRGQRGTITGFRKKLEQELSGMNVTRLKTTLKIKTLDTAEVTLQNVLSTPVSGKVTIQCQGKTAVADPINVEGKKTVVYQVPIMSALTNFDALVVRISFLQNGQSIPQIKNLSPRVLACQKRAGTIVVDGDLSDWDETCAFPLPDTFVDFAVSKARVAHFPERIPWKGKDDLSAVLYSCWDEENLYFAVKVKDDVFTPPPQTAGAYMYDSLQVYFDTLCDARDSGSFKGYDGNDYNYNFYPLKDGLESIRTYAPEWQIAFLKTGPASEVKRAFRKVSDGMIYEFAFPAKQIFPVSLKQGSSFGFALLINDNDNDYRKRGLTLTPAGTEPWISPHLYPVLILK